MTKREMFIYAHTHAKNDDSYGTYADKFRFWLINAHKKAKAHTLIMKANRYERINGEISLDYIRNINKANTKKEKEFLTRLYIDALKRVSRYVNEGMGYSFKTVDSFFWDYYVSWLHKQQSFELVELFQLIMENTRDDDVKCWCDRVLRRYQ